MARSNDAPGPGRTLLARFDDCAEGVTLDQCTECRGIFLDRGELERRIEAEDVQYDQAAGLSPASGVAYSDPGYGGDDPRRRRRGGFLGDLLGFGWAVERYRS